MPSSKRLFKDVAMRIGSLLFVIAAALCALAPSVHSAERLARITNETPWLCYYGDDRRVLDVPGYELLILESEGLGDLSPDDKAGRLCVAYMSVGEAESGRWYYPDIQDKPWVLDVNPDWPESRLVDVRSPEWRALIIDSVAAYIMAAGYDGFILDNVDTAEALLEEDDVVYDGADTAMAELIRGLRGKYPDAVIIANGGLDIVPAVADCIDAMMYEGTISTWHYDGDGELGYGEIGPQDKAWLRPRLLRVKNAGVPVLALEYVDPDDPTAKKQVWEEVLRAGNNPCISVRELDVFPGSDDLPEAEEND